MKVPAKRKFPALLKDCLVKGEYRMSPILDGKHLITQGCPPFSGGPEPV